MGSPTPPQAPVVVLADLLLDTTGWTEAQLEANGRHLYEQHCCAPAAAGQVLTHDGHPVAIYPNNFDHAFFTAHHKAHRGVAKDVIDAHRVQRIHWIVPVIAGLVPRTECWRVREWGHVKKPPPEKRLYIVGPEQYVVWLVPRARGGFYLKTAYVATVHDIERYIHRQTRIWSR